MNAGSVQSSSGGELPRFTPRQEEVLEAALGLLVSVGNRLTMAGVARAASCSKETLYNWFGDREGLLVATVQWQALKVGSPRIDLDSLTPKSLETEIRQFGENLLGVLSGDVSVALNRAAISSAGSEGGGLGSIVLQNGRFAMGRRFRPLLEAGRNAGFLSFEDAEETFGVFFGLLVRDTQIRLLLGEGLKMDRRAIVRRAQSATGSFLNIYGTGNFQLQERG